MTTKHAALLAAVVGLFAWFATYVYFTGDVARLQIENARLVREIDARTPLADRLRWACGRLVTCG